jgi:peptidoglycan/xylan/chitin deacetylase (PgdA/CDA1 family)
MHPRSATAAGAVLMAISLATASAAGVVAAERSGAPAPGAGTRAVARVAPTGVAARPSPSPSAVTPSPGVTVEVNGARVPAAGFTTVGAVLASAGLRPIPGRFQAVVSHRLLTGDGHPPRVYVDGEPASLATTVLPGQQVVVQPGQNLPEPTETVLVPVAPDAPTALYVGGRPGALRVVRGTYSHEVVSRQLIRKPRIGHLVRPGAVALTFDDGPEPGWTKRVLALLAHHHVHATFCMIGKQAAQHPALVRRVVRAGHTLCDHTWDHDLELKLRPRAQIDLDIRRAARAIERASHGVAPAFFRAPGGNWSHAVIAAARAQGMQPLTWTVDPRDWTRPGVRTILRTVREQLRPGGVILMHDGGGNRAQTIAALRVLLRRLPRQGYHFVLPPTG